MGFTVVGLGIDEDIQLLDGGLAVAPDIEKMGEQESVRAADSTRPSLPGELLNVLAWFRSVVWMRPL